MNSSKLAIFDTFKTKSKELTGEALRQRAIIIALATQPNPNDKTRTSISQRIADKNGIIWKNLYSGVFRDLDEILIPLKLVEEEGRLPLKRGPKALQEKGIPYYRLTQGGLLVALSIKEIKNKDSLLDQFFSNSNSQEKEFQEIIKKLSKIAPKFTFSLFEKYVKAFCEGKSKNLLPFSVENLRNVADETLEIQKEMLEAFSKMSKVDKDKTMNLLKRIG
ncbi:MAG TPA: hypothetical protein VFG25_00165 [Nitrosopumilaceae archaeon]|nr:hypothetical protein [Nitrosopumilaceae archaeon]